MGLFGKKAAPAPAAPERRPYRDMEGCTVMEAAHAEGKLTMTFEGPSGELRLEGFAKVHMRSNVGSFEENPWFEPGNVAFEQALASLCGRVVWSVSFSTGALAIAFEETGSMNAIYLVLDCGEGGYPGEAAAYLHGPGNRLVAFDKDGQWKLRG